MPDRRGSVKCTILTLRSENVMLPSAAIAEIISAKDAVPVNDSPIWYLGKMTWRGVDIPLVSYEAAAGKGAKKVNLNTQVAVVYSSNSDATHPLYWAGDFWCASCQCFQ